MNTAVVWLSIAAVFMSGMSVGMIVLRWLPVAGPAHTLLRVAAPGSLALMAAAYVAKAAAPVKLGAALTVVVFNLLSLRREPRRNRAR
jgi:hypothetical protein